MLVQPELVEDLRDDLESAIYLKEQLLTREVDRSFAHGGGRIVYAIDASVLHHVFEREDQKRTASKKAKNPKPHPYKVFQGPRTEATACSACERAERKLGKVISNYLVDSFASGGAEQQDPLLILPGHDLEVGNLYAGIAAGFSIQTDKLTEAQTHAAQLEAMQHQIMQGQTQKKTDYKRILTKLFDILYAIDRPHEQFHRFNRFTREQRLLKIAEAAAHSAFAGDAFREQADTHIFHLLHVLKARWHGEGGNGSEIYWDGKLAPRIDKRFRDNDKRALAALDLLNKQLRSANVRIVLFTLNDAILEAAAEYLPHENNPADPLAAMTFADLYLRHPRALLMEIGAVTPAERGVQRAGADARTSWLDPMLDAVVGEKQRLENETALDLAAFRRLRLWEGEADSPLSSAHLSLLIHTNSGLHKRFVERWTNFVEDLGSTHATGSARDAIRRAVVLGPDSGATLEEQDAAADAQETAVDVIGRIRVWVQQLTEESWADFFNNAADTGLELIRTSKGVEPPLVWPIPQLVVRGAGPRPEALRALWTVEDIKRRTSELYATIAQLRDETGFPNTYVQALGYGVIFAAMGRWPLAKLLAQRALQTIKTAPKSRDKLAGEEVIDGREAHYLLALAARICGDFDGAKNALGSAHDCFEKQRRDDLEPKLTGLRFFVETLEIEAAQIFVLSEAKRDPENGTLMALDPEDRPRLLDLANAAVRTLEACRVCATPSISRQSAIALRSLYFFALALTAEAMDRKPGEVADEIFGGVAALAAYVEAQLEDIATVYSDSDWMPLRDRALLQFAAAAASAELPEEYEQSYKDVIKNMGAPEHTVASREKRMLQRLTNLR